MHYKNGREAKNGDKVVLIPSYGSPITGILYDAVAGNNSCNGRIAVSSPNDPMPNLQEVLHIDDIVEAANQNKILDSTIQSGQSGSPLNASQDDVSELTEAQIIMKRGTLG